MKNLWNDADASACKSDLELRAYSSRLIGLDSELVLHGGGNTSVKTQVTDLFGKAIDAIYVKASGFDLAKMGVEGFTGLELQPLLALAELETLSDPEMVNAVRRSRFDTTASSASIEAIVHAIIPSKFVDHSHADAILTISNSKGSSAVWSAIYGDRVAVLPYVKPGFDLAKQIQTFCAQGGMEGIDGLILENHGLFTFAENGRESYDKHIKLVAFAERYLLDTYGPVKTAPFIQIPTVDMARLRKQVGVLAGAPVISCPAGQIDNQSVPAIIDHSRNGTVTPEHVIHNKPFPAYIQADVDAALSDFQTRYQAYFDRAENANLTMLAPNPHWAIFASGQVRSFGINIKRAMISADVAKTTVRALAYGEAAGGWQGLSEADLRNLEYWDLEQAKLSAQPKGPEMTGKVMLVTGAASGIGLACAQDLLARGAVVVGLDINPSIQTQLSGASALGIICDVTDQAGVERAVDAAVEAFGGIDGVVSNAGIFTAGANVENLDNDIWQHSLDINLTSHLALIRYAIPILKNGFDPAIVFLASRNVTAPGAGAAAYSVPKAALTQLMRVLALELAPDGIRVNAVHPDAVFDTGVWTQDALERSADRYGMTVAEYKMRNLLKIEITSSDVATAVSRLLGSDFSATTGAQIPVDGGNDRVI